VAAVRAGAAPGGSLVSAGLIAMLRPWRSSC